MNSEPLALQVPAWLRYLGVGAVSTMAHYALLALLVELGPIPLE
jgi:putative flippase GtrA